MRLIYITLRKTQTPKTFYEVVYPALVRSLGLPRNYKPIRVPGLCQALEDALERVKGKPSEIAIVTNGAGNQKRIDALLSLLPGNLIVNIFLLDRPNNSRQGTRRQDPSRRNVFYIALGIDELPIQAQKES